MKSILLFLIGLVGLVAAGHAQSPSPYRVFTLVAGGTNNVAATANQLTRRCRHRLRRA